MPVSAPTTDGFLLILAVMLPAGCAVVAFLIGGRRAERIAYTTMPAGLAVTVAIAGLISRTGRPLVYFIGNWAPPLGVALRADGLSAVMLVAP